jgi:RNA polymerase sigma factor (sigma-70 family)
MVPPAADAGTGPSRFHTTRWSMVLSCADNGQPTEASSSLADLCQIYWRPIFAFICRRGYPVADAQDLTQQFFVMILDGQLLQRADPARGRFRSLLLKALQNFLSDETAKKRAHKRGGQVQFISWDDWMVDAPSQLSIPRNGAETWASEKIFDVRWAATAVENALRKLGEECEARGRRRVFDVLSDCLGAEREDVSYQKLGRALGIPEPAVKRLVHQLRQRFRTLLREEVAQTVAVPDEIDEELRYLCAVLATSA